MDSISEITKALEQTHAAQNKLIELLGQLFAERHKPPSSFSSGPTIIPGDDFNPDDKLMHENTGIFPINCIMIVQRRIVFSPS